MFSSIWNETSVSGNRRSRDWPTWTPRNPAISRVRSGCALPENTFSSPKPVAMKGSPITVGPPISGFGWGGRIRTFEYGIQSPAPYRLATPHCLSVRCSELEEADLRSGRSHVAQTKSVYDAVFRRQGSAPLRLPLNGGCTRGGTHMPTRLLPVAIAVLLTATLSADNWPAWR